MKVLITGAGGFIGGHLAERLAPDHEVYALTRQSLQSASIQWIQHDLTRPLTGTRLPSQIDAVLHFAQSRLYREFPDQAGDVFRVNIEGTFALLDYARKAGAKHFIYASSGGIYGGGSNAFVESDPPASNLNFYLASKYAGELLVNSYRGFFQTTICRFFFVYGSGQNPVMLIPRLINSIQNGSSITVQGKNGIRINPIYIDDAIAAVVRCLSLNDHHVFNVAGNEILTMRSIAEHIGHVIGRSPIFTFQDQPASDLIGDISTMKEVLSTPHIPFSGGIRAIYQSIFTRQTKAE